RIAFHSNRTGQYQIWVMNADGSDQHQITSDAEASTDPAWSPDGAQIAFVRIAPVSTTAFNVPKSPEIFRIGAGGGAETQLTHDPSNDIDPAWSPDGSLIAFTSDRQGDPQIFTMDAGSGQGVVNVTSPGDTVSGFPDWSPDGSRIAFGQASSTATIAPYDILTMNAGGGMQAGVVER